jgi:signal transduction histidine kinase
LTSESASLPTPAAVLRAVVDVTREALGEATEASIADAVVRVSAALIGADQGTLGMVRGDEVITVAVLTPTRQPVGSKFPVGFGVAGWVAATGRPAEIQDVRQDKRYVALPYAEVRSFVGVPIDCDGVLVGVLSLAAWRPGTFAPETALALAPLMEIAALLLRHVAADEGRAALHATSTEALAESMHELKSPLHAAAGFVELVADEQAGPLSDQQRDFLNTARGEFTRVKEALATMVEVGAADARRPVDFELIVPHDLVNDCIQRFRGQALRNDVTLVEQIDPAAGAVLADGPAIQQVLANFVQNALRVVPSGSEIVVAATCLQDKTCFTVADRGPGLPAGRVEKLFEPFKQGDGQSGERRAGNVGLGLSLSRRIVEEHHGLIWAENRDGGGSRFCFALPMVKPQLAAA